MSGNIESPFKWFEGDDPRALWKRYAFALALVLVMLLGSCALKEHALSGAANDAETINIAGRQRMLSQRILYFSHKEAVDQATLSDLVDRFEGEYRQLKASPDLPDAVEALYFGEIEGGNIDALMTTFIGTARSLVADGASEERKARLRAIGEERLLSKLDAAVSAYEGAARARATWLDWLERGSLAVAVIIILLEALLIFWPGHRLAVRSLNRLERRNEDLALMSADLERKNAALEAQSERIAADAARLKVACEESERLRAEQADFTYAVSHDLKSPGNTLTMLLNELADEYRDDLPEDGQDLLDLSRSTVERMTSLVESVLHYTRTIDGEMTVASLDLDALLAQITNDLGASIREADAKVMIDPLGTIEACPLQIRMLMQNLLSNALKFRAPDRRPEITVQRWDEHDGAVTIVVADNGIGIAPENRERVFGLFQRLHTRDDYPGSGIGLALCQRVARNHFGQIDIGDSDAGGTVFTITLPATVAEARAA